MEFEEGVYALEALSELHSLPISLEKLQLCTSRNERKKEYYLLSTEEGVNNPPALESNLPVCTGWYCLGGVRALEP